MEDLPVNERLTIPAAELRVSFARSGGPGGQNVNKVESKVELRWRPVETTALDAAERDWLLARLAGKLTIDGDLVVTSSRTRDQVRNREDARAKLGRLVDTALRRPKRRRKTRPTRAAVEKRLRQKKALGDRKKRRGSRPGEE